jgi:hypothetical protein
MAKRKYDKYIINPPHIQMRLNSDGSVIFDGIMANQRVLNYNFTVGHQFVRKPFKGDNPAHTHNFQEFLCWYSGNPDDPEEFEAEVVLYMGEELVKYVFTRPTIVSLPPGLVHCPLEITKVERPIIQLEIMLPAPDGSPPTREPFFEKDKGFKPDLAMNFTDLSRKK